MTLRTQTDLSEQTLNGLQELIKINIDSAKGFETSAKTVKHDAMAQLFRAIAEERHQQAEQLQEYVELNDEDARDDGSLLGGAHRWWLKARGALTGGDTHAVLAEAERGEDAIKSRYESVLKHTAGSPVNDVLQHQYAAVKKHHDAIKRMRDGHK